MKTTYNYVLFLSIFFIYSCGMDKNMSQQYSPVAYADNQSFEQYSRTSNDLQSNAGITYGRVQHSQLDEPNKASDGLGNRERKIIRNANLGLIVKEIDTVRISIENLAEKYQGYVQSSGSHQIVIRVKSGSVEQVTHDIELLGKVKYKNTFGEDVSNQYYDAQIRLENALKSRDRYLDLLDKAENVQAALLVEKELERLNGTIDLLKGQMNNIDHLSTFATISVSLEEKKKLGILGFAAKGVWVGVRWLFVRN